MKVDLQTGEIFKDSGVFLKKLSCPLGKSWHELEKVTDGKRFCDSCERNVINTSLLTDDEVEELLSNNPETCLKVSLDQGNVVMLPRVYGVRVD